MKLLSVNIQKQMPHYQLDVSFTAKNNEIVTLFGSSGAGKTTILNCIAGLKKPLTGEISLQNRTIFKARGVNLPIQQRKIGYLFQDYALFPHLTALQNIHYGMKSATFAEMLMEKLHIHHLKDQYPHECSGGEKQRIAIVRALATEPDLLLLDEPFSALDDETKAKGHEELLHLHKKWGIPILLVTHNQLEAEKLSDRILYLHEGKIIDEAIFT